MLSTAYRKKASLAGLDGREQPERGGDETAESAGQSADML